MIFVAAVLLGASLARSQVSVQPPPATGQFATVHLPALDPQSEIAIEGFLAGRFFDGRREVFCFDGPLKIRQGRREMQANAGVLWVEHAAAYSLQPHVLEAYLEEATIHETSADGSLTRLSAGTWHGELRTHLPLAGLQDAATPTNSTASANTRPPVFQRAMRQFALLDTEQRTQTKQMSAANVAPATVNLIPVVAVPSANTGPIGLAQWTEMLPPQGEFLPGSLPPPTAAPSDGSFQPEQPSQSSPRGQRIRLFPRSSAKIQSDSFVPDGSPDRITIVDSGVNILIEGVDSLGTVDIATDRLVIWTPADMNEIDPNQPDAAVPLEFYLEGNVVFRQADRIIYANRMYYNVRGQYGVVLDAEMLASLPGTEGVIRLKSDVLRQVSANRFQANQAAITTSRMGVPRYWLQSQDLTFEGFPGAGGTVNPFDAMTSASSSGSTRTGGQALASARRNYVFVGGRPVFYWPFLSTDFTRPTPYINDIIIKNDSVFGTQLGLGFDLKQIFGVGSRLQGVDWGGTIQWLSERGVAFGSDALYERDEFFGVAGPAKGYFDSWFINDEGLDNLGLDRRALQPEEDFRGRVLWQHRQRLLNGWQVTGELGWISDRNFLEQYYELEWDTFKDQTTGIELKRIFGNGSWNLATDFRLNDFFAQTEWLPRLDQYQLGQSLFNDTMTWYGHSQVGYGKLEAATAPLDPVDLAKFNRLPWEVDAEGLRVGGRHEIDMPLRVGGAKVVPHVLGEVMHWGEDIAGNDNTRLYGQAGVRASLPMWSVNPAVQSTLFNINGLAHKIVWDADFFWAEASDNLEEFPLYDPLDDDATEHFRRRFIDDTFGGVLPRKFDERFFALRSGMQSWVTASSTEIADDLALLRLGARQRWQTKRGLPGRQAVVDLMTLDVEASVFPKANRDNFGQAFGLVEYDWRYHIGDRLTLTSDGFMDFFGDGLRMFSLGGYISRPERGSAYLGFRSIEGPVSSSILNAAFSYRLSHKWIAAAAATIDFGPTGSSGQKYELTRIGESFLVTVGANYDESRDNVGFTFGIEPRFLTRSFRGRVGGVNIPPAGAYGLE